MSIPKRPNPYGERVSRSPLEHEHAVAKAAVEALEEFAGFDCYKYDKHLNPVACGTCVGCRARSVLAGIRASGWTAGN